MSIGITHYQDPRTGAVDRIPLVNPLDWNARIHVPHLAPIPKDGEFYILTDEGEVHEVGYYAEASWWMCKDTWGRNDGEAGMWTADEIVGWSTDREDIEEAAMLFLSNDEPAALPGDTP